METKIEQKPAYVSREEKNGITPELLKSLYDYKDGRFYYKVKTNNNVVIGSVVGFLCFVRNEYRYRICINGKYYTHSRIIFFYHHGYMPEIVDHIDRNSSNDLIENLRAANNNENHRNSRGIKNRSSEYKGVHWCKIIQKWRAKIFANGKGISIGRYHSEQLAALSYNREAVRYFGDFAYMNIIKPDL